MEDLFGQHSLQPKNKEEYTLAFGTDIIKFKGFGSYILYQRYVGNEVAAESMIASNEEHVIVGVFPNPPLYTPVAVARNLYLKFARPIVVDQRSQIVIFAKMPIETGVYRQSKAEEMLVDSFSHIHQQYALYGTPESGVVCRYAETDVNTDKEAIKPIKYKEALVQIRIKNDIDNIVKVSKVIIPLDDVILDHVHDDCELPGRVEMDLNQTFEKDIVHIHLNSTKTKRPDRTSVEAGRETLLFLMDSGY